MVAAAFGSPVLPTKSAPDYVEDWSDWAMHGLPGPGRGTGVGNVSWKMGLQKLVWTIDGGMLALNASVWFSRNTSGDAPSNSPPMTESGDSPHCPEPSFPGYHSYEGSRTSDTLIIHHNGHSVCSGSKPVRTANCADCTPNYDTVQDWLNELGYDVFEMAMPLHGCNRLNAATACADHCVDNPAKGFNCSVCSNTAGGGPSSHQWFEQFETQGDKTMRYFLEPVVLAVNHAMSLGYTHVVLVGLSGGGWTTTIAAAMDPRIKLSMPIAGSVPKVPSALWPEFVPDNPEGRGKMGAGGDYEQNAEREIYRECGWICMYLLAALEPDRHALQMLHEHDSCCFATAGQHDKIARYNAFVQRTLVKIGGGWMQTAANWGNFHEVNYRDKTVIGAMIERLRRKAGLKPSHFDDIPFDILQNGPESLLLR